MAPGDGPGECTPLVALAVQPWARACRAALVAMLHVAASASLILFNKYVLSPQRFPFAVCLTTLHMLAAFLLSLLLRFLAPKLFPSAERLFGGVPGSRSKWQQARGPLSLFLPISTCCAISVVSANSAYGYASVAFLQMVKESVVMWVYLLGTLAQLEPFRPNCLAVLLFVSCSAGLAVCSDAHFRWPGLLLQAISSMAQASQAVLTSRLMMPQLQGMKVDPLSVVLGSAPVVLCLLLPITCVLWDSNVAARFIACWRTLLANACAAFGLQVVNAITIQELSATGLALAAVLKDLAIVGSAAVLLHDDLSKSQIVGFAGAVAGIAVYSGMKLQAVMPPQGLESTRRGGV